MSGIAETLLDVRNLSCSFRDTPLLHDLNFGVRQSDIVIIQGKSGSGKSTLLKCLAHLNVYEGDILYRGKTPTEHGKPSQTKVFGHRSCLLRVTGVPNYRTHVLYVPQRPSLLPGSPLDFLALLGSFNTHKFRERQRVQNDSTGRSLTARAIEIASDWGVDEGMWSRPWATLSGGEAQRISLATAVGLDCAEILLLDEPTSALDAESSSRVEKHLQDMLRSSDSCTKALVWITHSPEQGQRVGTRFIEVSDGMCRELLISGNTV